MKKQTNQTKQTKQKNKAISRQELRNIRERVFPKRVPNKGSRKGFPEHMINTNVIDKMS